MESLRRILAHRASVRICQVVIGVLFVAAALAKLGNLEAFATQVHNYRILPIPSENLVAMVLPWIELLAGLSLILRIHARAGAVVVTGLLVVFTAALAAAIARGLDFECGCFGTADAARVGWTTLGRDVLMLGVAVVATLRPR